MGWGAASALASCGHAAPSLLGSNGARAAASPTHRISRDHAIMRPDRLDLALLDAEICDHRVRCALQTPERTMAYPTTYTSAVAIPLPSEQTVQQMFGKSYDPERTLNLTWSRPAEMGCSTALRNKRWRGLGGRRSIAVRENPRPAPLRRNLGGRHSTVRNNVP